MREWDTGDTLAVTGCRVGIDVFCCFVFFATQPPLDHRICFGFNVLLKWI